MDSDLHDLGQPLLMSPPRATGTGGGGQPLTALRLPFDLPSETLSSALKPAGLLACLHSYREGLIFDRSSEDENLMQKSCPRGNPASPLSSSCWPEAEDKPGRSEHEFSSNCMSGSTVDLVLLIK